MGENRSGSTGEDRRQQLRLEGEKRIAHREDALMNPVQPARPDPSGGGSPIHPHLLQLFDGHQSVLTIGNAGDLEIPASRAKTMGHFVETRLATGWNV